MAFTKIVGAGIHTLSNVHTHNINSSGIITATQFVGLHSGTDGNFSGNVTIDGNLTVNGTTTTLDTALTEVDKVEVAANTSTVGVAITQSGSGDILRLYDGTARVLAISDDGKVGIGSLNAQSKLHVAGVSTTVWPFSSAVVDTYAYTPYPHEVVIDNDVRGVEGSFAGIYFNAGADTDGSKVSTARIAAIDTGSYKADLAFSNRGSGGSSHKENLRITSAGNVGIAQTDPSRARLHVVGDNTSGDIVAKFKSGGGGADSETYIALVTGYPDNVNDYEGHAHIGVQRNGATNGTSLVFKPHSGSGTSVTERMRITPTGSVTKPQQPYVHIIGITNTGGSGVSNSGTATTYGSITYSNGRVTAQVEGNYLITFSSISDNGTGRIDGTIMVNGTNIVNLLTSNNGTGYRQKGASIVYHLNANDYVEWSNQDWYGASNITTAWKTASVYLLG